MTCSSDGFCVIGYKVGAEKLIAALEDRKLVRGCNHGETKNPFCAQCGKPMWIAKKNDIETMDDIKESMSEYNFHIEGTVDNPNNDDNGGFVFLGVSYAAQCLYDEYERKEDPIRFSKFGSGYALSSQEEIDSMLSEAKQFLVSVNLWEEQTPRVWVAHWVSY